MKYKRILLKLSGEALMGANSYGIDPKRIKEYAQEIKLLHNKGVEIAIVNGVETSLGAWQDQTKELIVFKPTIWGC